MTQDNIYTGELAEWGRLGWHRAHILAKYYKCQEGGRGYSGLNHYHNHNDPIITGKKE